MYYTDHLTLPNYLCGPDDRMSPWALARLLQESAGHHAESAGMGFSQLIGRGKAWVLSRMYFMVDRMPHEGDAVEVRTWSRGTDGLYAFREFQLLDPQGMAAACSTYWVIIDMATRRATRIRDYWASLETHTDCATDQPKLDRLRLPADRTENLQSSTTVRIPVRLSMLDHTHHVNNAEYIRWIFDNLPRASSRKETEEPEQSSQGVDLHTPTPYRFSIEFLTETPPNDTAELQILPPSESGAPIYFRINNAHHTAAVAKLETALA